MPNLYQWRIITSLDELLACFGPQPHYTGSVFKDVQVISNEAKKKKPSFYVVAFVKFLVIGARVGPTLAGRFFPDTMSATIGENP